MNLREFVLIFEGSTPEKIKKGCANNLLTHPVTFGLIITLGRLSIGKDKCFVNCKKNARLIEVKTEFINITPDVERCVHESGVQEGLVLVNAMHITASVFINDDESGLHHDFELWLEKLAPEKPYSQYKHNSFEDNADGHLKRTIMGREVVVAISDGKLDFGPWEQIFYGEFDGKRKKRVLVKIIGD